jgi:2-phospho-L-lactate guanylyltransferase
MPDMTERGDLWSLVVPVKRLDIAKTRLAVGEVRSQLAVAMAVDTVAAALAVDLVDEVVVVTDDPLARDALRRIGARTVTDQPDSGLNAALVHGATVARNHRVAGLSSDLPALRPGDLADVLRAAAAHQAAVVADLQGSGTTLLAAGTIAAFVPAYGTGSFAAHAAGGAVDITAAARESVRRDVDTVDDLRAAVKLGVGPVTTQAIAALDLR